MKKLLTFPIIFVFFAAICTMSSAHAGGWKKSYHAGTFDRNLNYMGGTEIMLSRHIKVSFMPQQACG